MSSPSRALILVFSRTGECSRRNAAGEPAHPSCPNCTAHSCDRHLVDGDEFALHPPRWRICSASGRHRRQHVSCRSQDLLVIFIWLELLSLSLYILTAFDKHRPHSSEAALKYFLFGGMSAAFLLFGFSLLYGLSNSTSLPRIADAIHASAGSPLIPLLLIAIVTSVIGFGFKVAAFPFHFWAPDVTGGRRHRAQRSSPPVPRSPAFSSSSRCWRWLCRCGRRRRVDALTTGWVPVLAVVAALSMVLGNLVAIVQRSVRRLLAYSAIAHAGYMLLAIVAHTQQISAHFSTTSSPTRWPHWERSASSRSSNSKPAAVASHTLWTQPSRSRSLRLHVCFSAVACRHPSAGRLLRQVLSLRLRASFRPWPSLAHRSCHRHERGLPLLLSPVLKRIYVANPSDGVANASADATTIRTPILSPAVVVLLAAGVVLFGRAPHLLLQWIDAAIRATGF